jgi:vacuolar iron transporter family protein
MSSSESLSPTVPSIDAPPARPTPHQRGEAHLSHRSNWLRAAVLGANDGILSTSSLVLGVAGAGGSSGAVVTAGVAGLVAGALSMAAGEYVSVSSQRDTEQADLAMEAHELEVNPLGELRELAAIYEERGLAPSLAMQVAEALSERDALGAHVRDELGFAEEHLARPLQAAGSSAAAFSAGAILPLGAAAIVTGSGRVAAIVVVTLLALALLGTVGAKLGGAHVLRPTARVVSWGIAAMAVTYGIGSAVGTVM